MVDQDKVVSSFNDLGPALQQSLAAQNNPEVATASPMEKEKTQKADDAAVTAEDKSQQQDTKEPAEESKQPAP